MLNLFKRKRHKNNLVFNAYRIVTLEQARNFDVARLIDITLQALNDLFGGYPANYYITGPYPGRGWTTKEGFLRAVSKKGYRNICHLILSTDHYSFSFENWLLNSIEPMERDYQAIHFSVAEDQSDLSKLEHFARRLTEAFAMEYGCISPLSDRYLYSSRTKIKSDFWGASVKIDPASDPWREDVYKINEGILEGIYPINFINRPVLEHATFKQVIIEGRMGTFDEFNRDLCRWELKEQDIEEVERKLLGTSILSGGLRHAGK